MKLTYELYTLEGVIQELCFSHVTWLTRYKPNKKIISIEIL